MTREIAEIPAFDITFKGGNDIPASETFPDVYAAIEESVLPPDTIYRLAAIGCMEIDPIKSDRIYVFSIMENLARYAVNGKGLRPDVERLLTEEPPNAVIDYWNFNHEEYYRAQDQMHYRLRDLAVTIKEKLEEEGRAITDLRHHPNRHYMTEKQLLYRACRGIGRRIWRPIIERTHPEWIEEYEKYTPSGCIGRGDFQWREFGERRRLRMLVGAAVFRDDTLWDVYQESVTTGVRGIADGGNESLRRLLAEEHLKLYEV